CSSFFFQAEDGIRDRNVTGVQTCALPILLKNYARFLQELYRNMQNKGLAAYFDRIKSEVSRINIYDVNASEKVNAVLIQIEKERSEERRVGKECKERREK